MSWVCHWSLFMVNRHLVLSPQEKSCDDLEAITEALIQGKKSIVLLSLGQELQPRSLLQTGNSVFRWEHV